MFCAKGVSHLTQAGTILRHSHREEDKGRPEAFVGSARSAPNSAVLQLERLK